MDGIQMDEPKLKTVSAVMTTSRQISLVLFATLVFTGLAFSPPVVADGPRPVVEMSSLFNKLNLYPTGVLHIQELDLVFAQPGADIQVVVSTAAGQPVQTFNTLADFSFTNEVFARANMEGYAQAELEPGAYMIDTMIDGSLATRLEFSVVAEDSADPFAKAKKVHYKGSWQKLAYLHFTKSHNFTDNSDYQLVNFRMWGGFDDLDSDGEQLLATLKQDNQIIGHSKENSGFLALNKEINRVDLVLFKKHSRETEANVLGISQAELVEGNHTYHLTVARQKDGKTIRDFSFESRDGELVPLPRTKLGFLPVHDYLAPRALVHGTQRYEFEPVYWLEMK